MKARLVPAALALSLCLSGCGHMLFQPIREELNHPEDFGYRPDRVSFASEDGTRLSGWYFKAKDPKGVIVFFHGNGENISTHFAALVWVLDHGYEFFIFDYRGYGASEGELDRAGAVSDG